MRSPPKIIGDVCTSFAFKERTALRPISLSGRTVNTVVSTPRFAKETATFASAPPKLTT